MRHFAPRSMTRRTPVFVLLGLALACDPAPAVPEQSDPTPAVAPSVVEEPVLAASHATADPEGEPPEPIRPPFPENAQVREVSQIVAGLQTTHEDERYAKILERHARKMDEAWRQLDENFGQPMSEWAREHLEDETGTVFYPFSGADFFTVHRFYPHASHYVMVAMQHGRRPMTLDNLSASTLRERLKGYQHMAEALASRGFFVTEDMNRTLGELGITGQLMLIAEREGFDVLDVQPTLVSEGGELVVDESERPRASSVRIHMRRRSDGEGVTLDYVRANLANRGLTEDPGLSIWLDEITRSPVVAKAASHLMQQGNFFQIRDVLVNNATSVVQDESAIAYETLADHFEVQLFGEFRTVNELFRPEPQVALALAYEKGPTTPLPFVFGYDKSQGSALQVARVRR